MKNLIRILLLLAVAAGGFLAYKHFAPSEEERVQKLLTSLAKDLSIPAKVSPIGAAMTFNRLSDYFAREVQIEVDAPARGHISFSGRDELMQALQGVGAQQRNLKVEFLDINVKVEGDGTAATADLTAKGTQTGEQDFFIEEFRFQLKKVEKSWCVTRVESLKVLR